LLEILLTKLKLCRKIYMYECKLVRKKKKAVVSFVEEEEEEG